MRLIVKALLYITLVLLLIIFFAPKRQLYYAAEEQLEQYKVIHSGEFVKDSGFLLSLRDGTLYFEDLRIAKIAQITVLPLIVYNNISVAPFSFSQQMQSMVPGTVDSISITHSIVNPLSIDIKASGDFGELQGSVQPLDRNISLLLSPSSKLLDLDPIWLKQLQKVEDGGYRLETVY